MPKRTILIILIIALLLCSCQSSTKDNSDTDFDSLLKKSTNIDFGDTTYNIETDSQNYFEMQMRAITASPDGYFFFKWYPKAKILCFIDKNTKKCIPVCSRADCRHNDDSCDAAYHGLNYINYYNGSLYAVGAQTDINNPPYAYFYLYRISCDSSVYEKVFDMVYVDGNNTIVPPFIMHRGCVYYIIKNGEEYFLYLYDIDKKSKQLLYYVKDPYAVLGVMQGYGDGIFFTVCPGENEKDKLIYYNRKNGEYYEIIEKMSSASYTIINDGILYYDGKHIKKVEFTTLDETDFIECERVYVSYDGRYVYTDNEWNCTYDKEHLDYSNRRVEVYGVDGKHIDTINLVGNTGFPMFGDKDYMFFYFNDDNISMLDKSQIGTGKHEWVEVKED